MERLRETIKSMHSSILENTSVLKLLTIRYKFIYDSEYYTNLLCAFDFRVLRNRIFMQMSGKDLTIRRKSTHSQGYIHLLPMAIKCFQIECIINLTFIFEIILFDKFTFMLSLKDHINT